jgi:protein gp37
MGERTGIEWTHHSSSPWVGCTKVSAGCDNCYAENWSIRFRPGVWGPGRKRHLVSQSSWDQPMRWHARCEALGIRERVFPSMCDPFDVEVPREWLQRFWHLVRRTPSLDWILLTKRPHAMLRRLPDDWGDGWAHVWLGVSVENQEMADLRLPLLRRAPAAVYVCSYEPALGPVDFRDHLTWLSWVIAGGESGAGARPPDPDWFRAVRDQCARAGVPYFFKQWGTWRPACCPESADTPLRDAAPELRIEHFRRLEDGVLMERGGKAENGHVLDGAVWQQVPEIG